MAGMGQVDMKSTMRFESCEPWAATRRRNGAGLFAARAVIAFAFETIGCNRLEARSCVQNGRGNGALQKLLTERHVAFHAGLPRRLEAGVVSFLNVGADVVHNDFVTRAWTTDPVKALLARIPGFSRTAPRR